MEIFRLFGSIFINDNGAYQSLDRIGERGEKTSFTFTKLAGAAATLGGALVAAFAIGSIIAGVDDFQNSLNDFQASTGASNAEMVDFKGTLTEIYNGNYGDSFDDISKAMANVKQTTGASGEELKKLTTSALTLRDTFDFEVNESVRTANTLMNQFGITGDQAYTLIAQGAQNGANKNGDLLDTLNEYAPQFQALGLSAKQFTDVLISGANSGAFSIDKVGDAVKEFNIRAKDGSKTTEDAFTSLGLNASQMSQTFAAGGEKSAAAFDDLILKLYQVKDPVEQSRIGVELFGTQFEDLGMNAIAALGNVESVANSSADTLQKINQIKYNNIGEAFQGIGRNIETSIIVPITDKVLPKLSEFSTWIVSKTPEIKAAISDAMKVAGDIFDGLSESIQFVIGNFQTFLPIILGVTAAIAAQSIINTVVGLYKAWQTATVAMTTVQWLLNAAMDANPLGLVALAIGLLITAGVLLYQNWDTIVKFLSDSWTWMKTTAVDIFNSLVDFFIQWGPLIMAAMVGPIGLLIYAIIAYWDQIKAYTIEIWNSIISFFTTDIPAAFNTVVGFFAALPGQIYAFLQDLFLVKIPYAVGYAIGFMIQAFTEGIPKVIQFFKDLPGTIWTWLNEVITKFTEWSTQIIEDAVTTGGSIIKSIIDFFAKLPGEAYTWLTQALNRLIEWSGNAKTKASEAGRSILDSIIQFVRELPGNVDEWFSQTLNKVNGFATDAYNAAKDAGSNIVNGVVEYIKDLPGKVDEFVGGIVGKITKIANSIKTKISSIFTNGSAGIEAGANSAGGTATFMVPAYATGTNYATGGLALVGEEGPELVNLPKGAQVKTNDQTEQMLGGSPEYIQTNIHMDSRVIASVTSRPNNDMLRRRGRGLGMNPV